jgi:3-hydroxyisobutyrate dehydrogenase-like beta-hydroxyacid dehydrogenase
MASTTSNGAGLTVSLVATGEMGAGIGATLVRGGARVVTNLEGRSGESRRRAEEAGIEDVRSDEALVAGADIFLSILPPARSVDLAERIAAVAPANPRLAYLDCNAIAPQTMQRIAARLSSVGIAASDGGIVGPAPRPDRKLPRLYVSGPDLAPALALKGFGLDVRPAGEKVGDASALKLCYAALTKGTAGLFIELTAAAAAYGVESVLEAEMIESQKAQYEQLGARLPETFKKAHRYAGEMREMATAFGACGLPAAIFGGLADLYETVAEARRSNSRLRETTYPDLSSRLARVLAPAE